MRATFWGHWIAFVASILICGEASEDIENVTYVSFTFTPEMLKSLSVNLEDGEVTDVTGPAEGEDVPAGYFLFMFKFDSLGQRAYGKDRWSFIRDSLNSPRLDQQTMDIVLSSSYVISDECTSAPGWVDKEDETCQDYVEKKYCDAAQYTLSAWKGNQYDPPKSIYDETYVETALLSAVNQCCGCGGGTIVTPIPPAPTPLPPPTPSPVSVPTPAPTPFPRHPDGPTDVKVDGYQLLVNGKPFYMKGVCWNPIGRGGGNPEGMNFSGFADIDSEIMQYAGINVIRTYASLLDRNVLDIFYSKGIYVINSAYIYGADPSMFAYEVVWAVKDHPAILMWTVGNEWNYNHLYRKEYGMTFEEAKNIVREVVDIVKNVDPDHPVATIYGEFPPKDIYDFLPKVDLWSINAYRSNGFFDMFSKWESMYDKPMWLGEYGADAWDMRYNLYNPLAQAKANDDLVYEIIEHSSVTGGVCVGGTIFEWADEWWKVKTDGSGKDTQEIGGICPGGGPYPDGCFNEEWWGLVDIDRIPRPAFWAYMDTPIPVAPTPTPPPTTTTPSPTRNPDNGASQHSISALLLFAWATSKVW